MKTDPAIETVRRARRDISRDLGNDPARLIAHYMELQKGYELRLVHGPEQAAEEQAAGTGEVQGTGSKARS